MSGKHPMRSRFRGFAPMVVDVETGGFDFKKDALLEIAVQAVDMDDESFLVPGELKSHHIIPFKGANLDPKALDFNKIDPHHPFRFAEEERDALKDLFEFVTKHVKKYTCERAVLVGHNAWFDLLFLKSACLRTKLDSPFHQFTALDTATLSALIFGQTVLSKALKAAKIPYDNKQAHSAVYDTDCTTKLFCHIFNKWKELGGWAQNLNAS